MSPVGLLFDRPLNLPPEEVKEQHDEQRRQQPGAYAGNQQRTAAILDFRHAGD
jgi:hypothetical protein